MKRPVTGIIHPSRVGTGLEKLSHQGLAANGLGARDMERGASIRIEGIHVCTVVKEKAQPRKRPRGTHQM